MSEPVSTAVDKSFVDQSAKTEAPKAQAEVKKDAPKKANVKKENKPTQPVDKSFADDKKTVNKSVKVGDTVAYPYPEAEHGKRTSKVYEVTEDTVTILGHDGQKRTIAKDRVELA